MSNKIMFVKGDQEITGAPYSVSDGTVTVLLDKKFRVDGKFEEAILNKAKLIMTAARAEAAKKSRERSGLRCYIKVHEGEVTVGFAKTTGALLCYKNGSEVLL